MTVMSKSVMRRLETQQAHKQPKVPVFPDAAQKTYDLLNSTINEGGEKRLLAYMALTRLCVLWAPDTQPGDTETLVNDLIGLMAQLFPNGNGLSKCGPL